MGSRSASGADGEPALAADRLPGAGGRWRERLEPVKTRMQRVQELLTELLSSAARQTSPVLGLPATRSTS